MIVFLLGLLIIVSGDTNSTSSLNDKTNQGWLIIFCGVSFIFCLILCTLGLENANTTEDQRGYGTFPSIHIHSFTTPRINNWQQVERQNFDKLEHL